MYNKLLSFFTLLIVLCMGTTAQAATSNTTSNEEESPVMPFEEYLSQRQLKELHIVSTAAEFLKHWKQNHSIAIAADIDLSSFDESDHQIDDFTGELCSYDPDGITRYKLTKIPVTMAQHMTNAYIHDICFEDSRPEWDGGVIDNARGTSLVARYGKNCRVDNVVFRNVHVVCKSQIDNTSYGAIIFSHDEGSTFIDIEAYECTVFIKSNYAAILCAQSDGSNFYRCLVQATCGVYAQGEYANDGYAGAIAGHAKNAKFTECNSLCSVTSAKDAVGGIVGRGENCTFNKCNNYGCVVQTEIGSAEALENATKRLGAMTVTGTQSYEELVAAGQDNGLGNILGLAGQTEAFASITMLEKSMAEAYINWKAALPTAAETAGKYVHWRESGADLIRADHQEWSEQMISEETEVNYNMDKFIQQNHLSKDALDVPVKPTGLANSKALISILRAVSIAVGVYQIWSQIYDELDSDEVGGIVGYMDGGSINRCTNYGLVYCADVSSGGIVGEAHDANITNCLNQGLVQGFGNTGGIVGLLEGGSLKTCLNVGNVSNGNSSNSTFGRTYGHANNATISHNFFSSNVDRSSEDAHVAEVTLKMLATGEVAMMLNQHAGENVWRQSLGLDYYPNLAPASDEVKTSNPDISPTIRTKYASDFLTGIMNQYSEIELEGDIELNTPLANFSSQFMPFQGSIDGHGHRLKNLSYVAEHKVKSYWWWSNDNENKNVGLFSFAKNATFKDLELCDFNVIVAERTDICALFVGNSTNCTYENIHITGNSTIQADNVAMHVGGLVGSSNNDTFTGCTTGALCNFNGASSAIEEVVVVGGLVGEAVNSNFTECINRAHVLNDEDFSGGIVARSKGGKLERCLNTGKVEGAEFIGGMAGYAEDTEIHMCANTGLIKCIATLLQEGEVGGIVGTYAKVNADKALYECANWGDVHYSAGEGQGGIYGEICNSPSVHDNYYCFKTESGDYTSGCVDPRIVLTGEWAYTYDGNKGEYFGTKYYYQDIDNNTFGTHYPVPIAAAGEIFSNFDCKTQKFKYSNLYSAGEKHEAILDKFGLCRDCGSVYEAPANVQISESEDMVKLAYAVNNGQNFSNSLIELTADIDFADMPAYISPFTGIGRSAHPFSGTFDGNFHTIKNLVIEQPATELGLFSNVTGTTTIRNLIMDNTCALRSSLYGAGGFVGCTRKSTTLTLSHCGFEGFVSGYRNAGTMLGGVFSSDGATVKVNIDHCYNTGTVKGDTESGSFCGYAGTNAKITCSWNSGTVTGYKEGYPMAGGTSTTDRAYDTNTTNEKRKITADDIESGRLAFLLNGSVDGYGNGENEDAWYQQIGEDSHPTFIRNTDHRVYHHDYTWCDAPETTLAYYDNKTRSSEEPFVKHDFDNNGICERTLGQVHGEECPHDESCWHVSKIGHLYNIAQKVNSGGKQLNIQLENDLYDNTYVIRNGALITETKNLRRWAPIGTEVYPYTGTFNGKQHTISGLFCEGPVPNAIGLFGCIKAKGTETGVAHVGVTNSYFGKSQCGGAIAGKVIDSNEVTAAPSIHNCYSTGIIDDCPYSGGIVGEYILCHDDVSNESPVYDCYSVCKTLLNTTPKGQEEEDEEYHGGIIGKANNLTKATKCYYLEDENLNVTGCGEAKTELAFRLGEVCDLLEEGKWSQAIDKQQAPVFGEDGVSYSRTVTPGNWASLILPFPVTSDKNVQFYTFKSFSGDGYDLHLETASTVPANTPCFFKTSNDCAKLCLAAADNSVVAPSSSLIEIKKSMQGDYNMYLIGSYDDITVSPDGLIWNYYVAQNKLWWGEEAFNLPAFRAYIKLTDQNLGAKSINIVVDEDGETTQIGEIHNGKLNMFSDGKYLENGRIVIKKNNKNYNLNGQKIK